MQSENKYRRKRPGSLSDMPYLQLYAQDFLSDEKLAKCSASATGVYIRLLCILHKSKPYGTLRITELDKLNVEKYRSKISYNKNGKSVITTDITTVITSNEKLLEFAVMLNRQMPYFFEEIFEGLSELFSAGIIQIEGDTLSQKRMIEDAQKFESYSVRGKLGMQSRYKNSLSKDGKISYNKNDKPVITTVITKSDIDNDIIINNKNKDSKGEECEQSFEKIWDLYDKKRGDKKKLIAKWSSLSQKDKAAIFAYVPQYVKSTPDKQYRKDFATFLNNRSWNDEIIDNHGDSKQNNRAAAGNHCQGDAAAQGISEDKSFTTTL